MPMAMKSDSSDKRIFDKNPEIKEVNTSEGIIISRADLTDDSIYYLDSPVSCRIWALINGKNTLGLIRQKLLLEFDISPKTLNRDLKKFIKDLSVKNIITNVG